MVKFCLVLIAVVACWAVNVQGDDDVEAAWSKHRVKDFIYYWRFIIIRLIVNIPKQLWITKSILILSY